MFRNFAAVIATCIALLNVAPVHAEDGSVKGAAMIPVKFAAFATGAVVGTPIAMVRYSCANTTSMSADLSKNDTHILRVVCAGFTAPFAIFKGGLEGLYHGTANSWTNSSEHPFGKDSFSLGEMSKD